MDENFLLSTPTAQELYHNYAKNQPIFDYHCHLNPQHIAENKQFAHLAEIWLEGDHYKWRALRSAGVDEYFITGKASAYEKYQKWAETIPKCMGNPLYHWTHLELKRPFGITNTLFNPHTAEKIWHHCNELLQQPEYYARGILQQMNVVMVGTTDDPIDDLRFHHIIAYDPTCHIEVVPTFRPDKAFKIEHSQFNQYIQQLSERTNIDIQRFSDLQYALTQCLDYFDLHGCKSADHGIEILRYAPIPTEQVLDKILQERLQNNPLSEQKISQFSTALLVWLGQEYHKRHWVMQYHIGAIRNNNTRMYQLLGADSGFDSIGDRPYATNLAALLDQMDKTAQLPKTILYCLNPRDNEMIASMIGNFQSDGIAGKIQFGSAWWFNDQKDGMERQLQQLSQFGLLSQFVGMLTDSRSFLSYTRHEYFRRILCELVGGWVERGEVPNDRELIANMIKAICYSNAKTFFKGKNH